MIDDRWRDDEIETLIAAARDVPPAPADARARVAARLAATITPPAGDPGVGAPPAGEGALSGASAAAGGATLSTGGWAAVVALTLAVGIGIGWLRPGVSTQPAPRAAVERPASEAATPAGDSTEAPSHPAHATAVRSASAEPSAPAGLDRALAAERALLQAARDALVERRLDPALDALATHRSRFPAGRLIEERELLWIRTLLAAERGDDARARAAAFVAAHPDSLFRPAVEALIAR